MKFCELYKNIWLAKCIKIHTNPQMIFPQTSPGRFLDVCFVLSLSIICKNSYQLQFLIWLSACWLLNDKSLALDIEVVLYLGAIHIYEIQNLIIIIRRFLYNKLTYALWSDTSSNFSWLWTSYAPSPTLKSRSLSMLGESISSDGKTMCRAKFHRAQQTCQFFT